ncbi:glycosyltransferase family 4 protein [Stutzerimonas chloritidismutans]|uniref:glycosyltransferase family 4 protein n=1 Tax=Stutzerimonas stutzeri subgroup TaxID=578833 RepID=UPI00241CB08B|nr:glycosyltransferase family 1 protein [Stutzerimonas kunmingensis]
MIAINARFLTQETRGVQRFAEQVCLELAAMRKDLTFVAPDDIRMHASAERLQVRRIGRNHGHLWEQLDLPLWLARHGYPPLVSLCNTAPLIYRNQIATHHDITYVRHPESYSRTFRSVYKGITPLLLKRIKALITVSDFSRKEIARYYGYPSEKICVVPNAVAAKFHPPSGADRSGNARPYVLAVSSPNAHKNFARMVAAFLSLEGFDDVELHIVGDSHSVFSGSTSSMDGNPRVRILGRLNDDQLVREYQGATAFVFPSLYEGFGIPPLEAQACGCPVIAARAASIPEVLGESVLYFEPLNIEDIARCMRHVLQDARLRDDLRTLGLANVERYSWKRSAQTVSQLIDKALMGKPSPPSFIVWSSDRP